MTNYKEYNQVNCSIETTKRNESRMTIIIEMYLGLKMNNWSAILPI